MTIFIKKDGLTKKARIVNLSREHEETYGSLLKNCDVFFCDPQRPLEDEDFERKLIFGEIWGLFYEDELMAAAEMRRPPTALFPDICPAPTRKTVANAALLRAAAISKKLQSAPPLPQLLRLVFGRVCSDSPYPALMCCCSIKNEREIRLLLKNGFYLVGFMEDYRCLPVYLFARAAKPLGFLPCEQLSLADSYGITRRLADGKIGAGYGEKRGGGYVWF